MPDPGCNPELPLCSANCLIHGAPATALWLVYGSFLTDGHGVIVTSQGLSPPLRPCRSELIPQKLLSLCRHEMLVLSNCHPLAVAPFSNTSQSLVVTPPFPIRDQLLELLYVRSYMIYPNHLKKSSSSIIVATLPFVFSRVSPSTDWPVTFYIAQAVNELTEICLPLVSKVCMYHPTQPFYSFFSG